MLRLSTRRPWQSVLSAASAAWARPPAVAEAIDDHCKLPKGVVRQPGIKIMFLLVKPDGMSAKESHQYWIEAHSPLVVRRSDDMAMQRYIQSPSFRLRWPSAPPKRAGEVARKTGAA
jgi:hypothetical protein